MSTPTTGTMLDLIRDTQTRTLRADEARLLREGILILDQARAGAHGLQAALHTAIRDGVVYAAACRRIQALTARWHEQRPTIATTQAAIDAITDALAPTQGAS